MLISTQGFVLQTIPYSETSVIVKIFTRELGLRSYILKGVRGGRSKTKQNLLQPLSHLDLVVYDSPKSAINYVKDIHSAQPFNGIALHPVKSSLVFFMNEVLLKSLRESEPNLQLYSHTLESLRHVDSRSANSLVSFPIEYMLQLCSHLGIEPMDNYSNHEPLFHLSEGRFLSMPSLHHAPHDPSPEGYLQAHQSFILHNYLYSMRNDLPMPLVPLAERNAILSSLVEYYRMHLSDFGELKSLPILHAILS